ncbi:MAG: hypothetical protein ABIJ41_04355 [Candidatus Omnitrophota bacterium]
MKKTIFLLLITAFLSTQAWAVQSGMKVLAKEDIEKLSDSNLLEAFTEIVVEIEASKALHNSSGFTPDDYETFKNLLRYRIRLIQEMNKRKLELPQVE